MGYWGYLWNIRDKCFKVKITQLDDNEISAFWGSPVPKLPLLAMRTHFWIIHIFYLWASGTRYKGWICSLHRQMTPLSFFCILTGLLSFPVSSLRWLLSCCCVQSHGPLPSSHHDQSWRLLPPPSDCFVNCSMQLPAKGLWNIFRIPLLGNISLPPPPLVFSGLLWKWWQRNGKLAQPWTAGW